MTPKFIMAVILIGVAVFSCGKTQALNVPTSQRAEHAIMHQTPHLENSLSEKGLALGSSLFLRIIKTGETQNEKGYLEAFIEDASGEFTLFKTWEICTWSGRLGPKLKQGDGQSPEGFYFVRPGRMNPHSSYHLSFNLGYPNAYDRAHGRTGDFLMVHGKCVSIGCYAMTDQGIEEIYTLMHAAFKAGQPFVRVHIFPFSMSDDNMVRFDKHKDAGFWENLKIGWDFFETDRRPPNVEVKNKVYIFNPDDS